MSNMNVDVKIEEMKEMPVAYIRHTGPFKGDVELFEGLYTRLVQWAGPRGLLERPDALMMSVYHDDPKSTDESKLRVSVCVTVPEGTKTDGDVGYMVIPGGKYAVARFEIDVTEYENAWKVVYGEWLPGSGFQPEDGPSFELCRNDPRTHPEGKHIIDICIPVKPM